MPSLFVIRGADQGAKFELQTENVLLGRDRASDIQLRDSEVSRRHAEFHQSGGEFTVQDLESSNGTFVNGRRVQRQTLASGDQVQTGTTVMLYTGAPHAGEDVAEKINIVAREFSGERSRIVRAMSHEEGSRVLDLGVDSSDSPWLARARSNLQIMYRTALAVSHTLDIDQLLSRIMELIFEWVEADRGCVMLLVPGTNKLEPRVRRMRGASKSEDRISISQTILDYVLEHSEGVMTSDAQEDSRWDSAASILQMGVREAICVPMQGRYDVVGVIYIDTSTPPQKFIQQGGADKFSEEHLKLMIAIAHQAALAVEDTRYYSAMVQSERLAAVGQTIAVLSHHIKNILQGIRGGSYLIELGLSDKDESVVRKGWDIVEKNQAKISALVMDMLTFSKERRPDLVPANLNQIVRDVVELMESRAAELGVTLQCEPAGDMPTLVFDPEGLHRAALNVVTNALDACGGRKDGRVTVRTHYTVAQQTASVIVEDNGEGIPPDQLTKIFTLFESNKGGRGTGLGLAVTKKILEEHGGRVSVDSTPETGSRFTIEFPAVPHEQSEDRDTAPESTKDTQS